MSILSILALVCACLCIALMQYIALQEATRSFRCMSRRVITLCAGIAFMLVAVHRGLGMTLEQAADWWVLSALASIISGLWIAHHSSRVGWLLQQFRRKTEDRYHDTWLWRRVHRP
jgi:hypothetical protein